MRDSIKSIVDKYGTSRLHYSLIAFGATASTKISFSAKLPDKDAIKRYIDGITLPRGGPALDQALIEAKNVFDGAGVRPNAKKVCIQNKQCAEGADLVGEGGGVHPPNDSKVPFFLVNLV
jgi:hypothetical protein